LKQYPFQGKNVRIIACSGGGDAEKAFVKIKEKVSVNNQEDTREKIKEWMNK